MKFKVKILTLCFVVAAGLSLGWSTWAEGNKKAQKTPPLKQLMAQLYTDLQEVNYGLLYSDMKKVAEAAKRIAQHPPIQVEQRKKIAKTLGPKMGEFKGYDMKVHGAAVTLAELAAKGDLSGAATSYNTMINNCVRCHQKFREQVIPLFQK